MPYLETIEAMTTDRAAALAAKLEDGIIGGEGLPATSYLIDRTVFDEVIAALEASRPAQDIVAELDDLEKAIQRRIINYFDPLIARGNRVAMDSKEEDLTIIREIRKRKSALSPTKNTAPTEAEI